MVNTKDGAPMSPPPWARARDETPPDAMAEPGIDGAEDASEDNEHGSLPSYAATTLTYGIQVDARSLLYRSRAYFQHKPGWDVLLALRKGKVVCRGKRSIATFPLEVIQIIINHFRETTYEDAECDSWLLFGDKGKERYHPKYCCQFDPILIWPARVEEEWISARDEFQDHFSFTVPRCARPCLDHHACDVSLVFKSLLKST